MKNTDEDIELKSKNIEIINDYKSDKLSFLKYAEKVFEKIKIPLTSVELWDEMTKMGAKSTGKTPWKSISSYIYVDIKNNSESIFCQYTNPTKFFLTRLKINIKSKSINSMITSYESPSPIISDKCDKKNNDEKNEKSLHPYLSKFVDSDPHFKSYTKTIRHEISIKGSKGQDEWRYPDLVGVSFPIKLETEILRLQETSCINSTKYFSFEMKKKIGIGDLRKSYFQTVSNSGWANEGYLVAEEIDNNQDLLDEMIRLHSIFGIGIIKLNISKVHESEIILQSKYNTNLDWDYISVLSKQNRDFNEFVKNVNEDYSSWKVSGKWRISKDNYDVVE